MLDAKRKGRMKIKSKGKIGIKNNSAKLNDEKVVEIRKLLDSKFQIATIARRFDVCRKTILNIKNKLIWTHV